MYKFSPLKKSRGIPQDNCKSIIVKINIFVKDYFFMIASKKMLKTKFLLITTLLLTGCSSKIDTLQQDTEHKKNSNEFKIIMHELSYLIYDTSKSELEIDNIRRRYAFTLADKIQNLTLQTTGIPEEMLSNISFSQYIQQLNTQGKELQEIAKNYELEKLNSKIDAIKRTCTDCHDKVRSYK